MRTLAGAMVALVLVAVVALPAAADSSDAEPVRWSVTPSGPSGPDGRAFVQNTLDPGESADDYLAVRNVSDQTVEFKLTAASGYYTRQGRFDILPADQASVGAGSWIEIPPSVIVGGGQTVVVPYSITVPERAEPGDHAAGITASVLSIQQSDDGASVGVETRVGFRVTTRVTGQLAPSVAMAALGGDYRLSWNPLRPGQTIVSFDIVNDGNTILLARGMVEAGGRAQAFPAAEESPEEILAGDTRTIRVAVDDVWPLFLVPTRATVSTTVLSMSGEESALAPVEAELLVWAVPWPQLIVLAGLVLVVLSIFWGRARSRKKLALIVAEAKEQGRREAAGPSDASGADRPGSETLPADGARQRPEPGSSEFT